LCDSVLLFLFLRVIIPVFLLLFLIHNPRHHSLPAMPYTASQDAHKWLKITEKVEKIQPRCEQLNIAKHLRLAPSNKFCDVCVGGHSSGKMKRGRNMRVPCFIKVHDTYKTIKLFFYMYSNNDHDEHVFNLELVLFHLKHKTWSEPLSITNFLGAYGDFNYLIFYYFEDLSWKLKNFHFLLLSLPPAHFNAFLQLSLFHIYCSLSTVPWKIMDRGFIVFIYYSC
jgi:hypothetical protein